MREFAREVFLLAWNEQAERFINPYNFIALSGEKSLAEDDEKCDFTGVISCKMLVKTPVFLPDVSSCQEDKIGHKSYDFFKIDGRPVMPGSEIRGMLRSVYEAATNSCMSALDDIEDGNGKHSKVILTSRTLRPKLPGILCWENNGWVLYKANRFMLTNSDYGNSDGNEFYTLRNGKINIDGTVKKHGEMVKFIAGNQYKNSKFMPQTVKKICGENERDSNIKEGYLCFGEMVKIAKNDGVLGNKHHNNIFTFIMDGRTKAVASAKINPQAIEGYEQLLKDYSDKTKNKTYSEGKHGGYKDYRLNKDAPNLLWYEVVGKNLYLSPACISRTAYYNNLSKLAGKFKPCSDTKKLCKACGLFGTVTENGAFASRIRIADGIIENGFELEPDFVIFKELSGPKSTCTEFYTTRPDGAKLWNYDYKTTGYFRRNPDYAPIGDNGIKIRGRKFYWHHYNCDGKEYYKSDVKTKRNISAKPLNKGEFAFKIFLDGVSRRELNELLWVLTFGENSRDSSFCHKIGMGKPIGLGSVKIVVERLEQRELSFGENGIEYAINNVGFEIKPIFDVNNPPDYIRELLKIADFSATKEYTVAYPIGDDGRNKPNSKAGHQRFKANKTVNSPNDFEPNITYTLPEILSKDTTLPAFKADSQNCTDEAPPKLIFSSSPKEEPPKGRDVTLRCLTQKDKTFIYHSDLIFKTKINVECPICGKIHKLLV